MRGVVSLVCACVVLAASASPTRGKGQDRHAAQVLDRFVTLYNRLDFVGIHRLSSPSFAAKIREAQLVRFFENNLSTGRIVSVSYFRTVGTAVHYRLDCEARTLLLVLDATPDGRIESLGLTDFPQPRFAAGRTVPTSNPRLTLDDLLVDDAAREYFREPGVAGLSIGLVRGGRRSTYHYGEMSRKGELPDDRTVYQIESLTKTFAATLLARAVVDGRVGLDDDVRRYLPGSFPTLEKDGQPVTLRSLANHSSGLPRTPANYLRDRPVDRLNPAMGYTDARLLDGLRSVTLQSVPGTRAEYSNLGMDLLAYAIERAYGESYPDLLRTLVTGPLGMTRTRVGLPPGERARVALPHGANGRVVPFDRSGRAGAGGLTSTTAYMLAYVEAQIREDRPEIALTHVPTVGTTGLGWGVRTLDGVRDLQHNGSGPGFRSHVTVYPDLERGLVVLLNQDSAADGVNRLVASLQRVALRP